MLRVAVLGSNGFIGSRAVEMLHLQSLAEMRPVVRDMYSLARLSRFELDCRVADAFDTSALCKAFKGCDIIIHAIAGDHNTIVESLTPTYKAAEEAGVRRIVYLSTASVHGQSPEVGTNENSVLNDHQSIAYNNSKVLAERKLIELRSKGKVELVMLRPSIVFGPRSFWISNFASDLLLGQAYIVNEGKGICNSIYVDNLIHAIYLACTTKEIDGEAFLVGDNETITWADLYRPVANALGFDLAQVPDATYSPGTAGKKERIKTLLKSPHALKVLSLLPNRLVQSVKAGVSTLLARPAQNFSSPWAIPELQSSTPQIKASLEMSLLHQCQYKLLHTKAKKIMGYEPIVSFQEACARTVGWLAFSGYPVIEPYQLPTVNSFHNKNTRSEM